MTAHSFSAFISLKERSPIADLPATFVKHPQAPSSTTLTDRINEVASSTDYNGIPNASTSGGVQTPPKTPNEMEMSRPTSPRNEEAVDIIQTLSNPPMNMYRLLSACLMCFGNGLGDSAPGALIPYMEAKYHIGYAVVSLIFVSNAMGYISAAPITHVLQARFGRAKMLVLAESIMTVAYIMLIFTPPFPVVVLSFYFTGLGQAFNLALNNTFCANLANSTITLGFFHGSYGIGGTVAPLIATALVSKGHTWSTFYFISLSTSVINALIAYLTFRTYERRSPSKSRHLKEALVNKTTIFGALFIFAYQGAEVSISGWVVSFLISYRRSSPAHVGYVTAGFWAGITIGRFLLSHPAHKIGEKIAVSGLVIGAVAFQILVWQIPNVVGEAVAVSIVGLLLGPVYPCATAIFTRLLDRRLQMSSLAAVSAWGSSGGAVAPFFTGLLAQQVGTWVLHPICVGLYVAMLACWASLPKAVKRRE